MSFFFLLQDTKWETRNSLIRIYSTVKTLSPSSVRRLTMASVFRSRRPLEPRSGGKIVRPRRTIAPKNPYDRPTQQFINPPHENPNWISRLILSPTRMVVNGAGKLLSAVFNSPDSYSSSSSSAFASVSGINLFFCFLYFLCCFWLVFMICVFRMSKKG